MKRFLPILSFIILLLTAIQKTLLHPALVESSSLLFSMINSLPKGFVKLEKSLRETLPEITFSVINLKGDSSDEVIFQGSGVTLDDDYIRMDSSRPPQKRIPFTLRRR